MASFSHLEDDVDTNSGLSFVTGTFNPGAGLLMFAIVVVSGSVGTTLSCQSNVNPIFSKIVSHNAFGGLDQISAWVANDFSLNATQGIVFTTNDNATGCLMLIGALSGMSKVGLDAVRQFKVADGDPNEPAGAIFDAACLTDNPVLWSVGCQQNPAGVTPPTGWTEPSGGDIGYSVPSTGGAYAFRDNGFTGTDVHMVADVGSDWMSVIVEFDSSAVPGHPIMKRSGGIAGMNGNRFGGGSRVWSPSLIGCYRFGSFRKPQKRAA